MNWIKPLLVLEWGLLVSFIIGGIFIASSAAIRSINPNTQIPWLSKITNWHFFWHILVGWIIVMSLLGAGLAFWSATRTEKAPMVEITTFSNANLSVLMLGGNVFTPDIKDIQQLTGIALTAKVWNTGSPSVAVEWSLNVTPKGQIPVFAQWTQMPETLTLNGTPNSTVLQSSDALDKKTANIPIGDTPIEGTLLFYVELQQAVVLDPSTRLDLSVRDIYGGTTSDTRIMGDWLQR